MKCWFLIALLLSPSAALADLVLGTPFGDHMVVQHDKPVHVWGWDEPGQVVRLYLGGASARAICGDDGKFEAELPAPALGIEHELAAEGTTAVRLSNVVAGDVWFCAGQSNMNFPLFKSAEWPAVEAGATVPGVRMFNIKQATAAEPQATGMGEWVVADPALIKHRSAVAYHFAVTLHEATGRPVGIVQAAYGGTMIEAWLPADAIDASPAGPQVRAWWKRWMQINEPKLAESKTIRSRRKRFEPSGIYHAMQHPFEPLSIAGVLWYQGESNALMPARYADLFPSIVDAWRSNFRDEALPVVTTQLPNFEPPKDDWAMFREVQRNLADELAGVGMAVAIDLGDPDDIHPTNKRTLGRRLADVALARAYDTDRPLSPRPITARREGGAIIIDFEHIGEGLELRGCGAFEIIDSEGQVHVVDATLRDNTVRVAFNGEAATVRYAYANNPTPTLFNKTGLPAVPFVMEVQR
ncbi:MAG: sialate O-acetylesterase [Planctomycetota bacterium]